MFCAIAMLAILNGAVCQVDTPPMDPAEFERIALLAGWEEDQLEDLHCAAYYESSYRPGVASWNASGPGSSIGLMQINHQWVNGFSLPVGYVAMGGHVLTEPLHLAPAVEGVTPYDLLDPRTNLEVALFVLERQGWDAWDGYAAYCQTEG